MSINIKTGKNSFFVNNLYIEQIRLKKILEEKKIRCDVTIIVC